VCHCDSTWSAAPKQPQPVTVTLWGSGQVYREFLHVADMTDAWVQIMQNVEAPTLYDEMPQIPLKDGIKMDYRKYDGQ
jgi:GDP-L-fucose synthase